MIGEISQPEIGSVPEAQLFNVDALDNYQITMLYRALDAMAPASMPEGEEAERQYAVCDSLWEKLAAEVRDLASRDPARVRELVSCSVQGDQADREFAAVTAGCLIDYDYGFTRDVLVMLYTDRNEWTSESSFLWAGGTVARLMRDKLSPDQIADFNAQLVSYGGHELTPAASGDERR